ncbi:hypothetical protein P3S67_025270 [Capsicum chacoense]
MSDFSASINVNSAFEAEVTALIMGLNMAAKHNYTQPTVSTDSLQLCQGITNIDTNETNLVCMCRDLLRKMGNVQVLHEARSANVAADRLAKEDNKLARVCFCEEWEVPPLFIRNQLELDKKGTCHVDVCQPNC